RIEALDVAHLKLQTAGLCMIGQDGGFLARGRHRLLDQHVHFVLEEEFRKLEVSRRALGDGDGVDASGELAVIREEIAAEGLCNRLTRPRVDLRDPHELHVRQTVILLGMKPSQVAYPHDGGANRLHPLAMPLSELVTKSTSRSMCWSSAHSALMRERASSTLRERLLSMRTAR